MEQTAEPGMVQIAHDTYKLVKNLFEFKTLGSMEVKGKSEPVLAYQALGRKFELGRTRGIEGLHAAMVGRDPELFALRMRWPISNRDWDALFLCWAKRGWERRV